MGKIRELFKKIRDTKGTFHANMGTIKDRNGKDLTEDQEESLEEGMAAHSNTLAWKIPLTENPGRIQSMGSPRARHD